MGHSNARVRQIRLGIQCAWGVMRSTQQNVKAFGCHRQSSSSREGLPLNTRRGGSERDIQRFDVVMMGLLPDEKSVNGEVHICRSTVDHRRRSSLERR